MLNEISRSSCYVQFLSGATFCVVPRSRVKRAKITRRPNGIKSTRRPVICENVRPSVATALRPAVFV